MKCKRCDRANDADANYCNACGSVLKLPCHNCGQDNRPESRFCKSCGRYLHPERDNDAPQPAAASTPSLPLPSKNIDAVETVLEGEHKHVTVLFTDLCGYTAIDVSPFPRRVMRMSTWKKPTLLQTGAA